MNLSEAIIYKYGAKEGLDLDLRNNKILNWPYDLPKPNKASIEKLISDYKPISDKVNKKKDLKLLRDKALESITVEVNGNIYQARKSDEVNFRLTLSTMEDGDTEGWLLKNDTEFEATKAELEEAYMKGLLEGKRIFNEYKAALKAL